MKAFSFKKKSENLAVVVHILQATRNLVISRCCFAEDGKKCTKNYNAWVKEVNTAAKRSAHEYKFKLSAQGARNLAEYGESK